MKNILQKRIDNIDQINFNLFYVFLNKFGIFIFLFLILLLSCIFSPAFLSSDNVSNMLLQYAPLGIVVIGQTFVILTGGLDLSVASLMATAAVITTGFSNENTSAGIIILLSFALGTITGVVNGLLVSKRNVSPFLATLATMIMLQGVRFAYTQGAPSGNVPNIFKLLGTGSLFGIPINFLVLVYIFFVFWLILHKSGFGRKIFITGGNNDVARLVGIKTDSVIIICYTISSLLACVSGLILSGYVGIVDNWVGKGFELDSIVACVMGGVALSGGTGTIIGALAGGAILIVIFNIVLLVGLPVEVQVIIKGAVIIIAATFYVGRK